MSGVAQRMLARARGEVEVVEPRIASRFEGLDQPAQLQELDTFVESHPPRRRPAVAVPPPSDPVSPKKPQRPAEPPAEGPGPAPEPMVDAATLPPPQTREPVPIRAQPPLEPAFAHQDVHAEPDAAESLETGRPPSERTILAVRRDVQEIDRITTVTERVPGPPQPPIRTVEERTPPRTETAAQSIVTQRERTRAYPIDRPAPRIAAEAAPPPAPEIHVRIGRIEIVAPPPAHSAAPPPARRVRPEPALSLTDYLAQRTRGDL